MALESPIFLHFLVARISAAEPAFMKVAVRYVGAKDPDLSTSNFFSQDSNWANFTIDELFSNYNLTLRSLLDKHLPVRKMTRRVDPLTPWFDADCVRAKRNVRRL